VSPDEAALRQRVAELERERDALATALRRSEARFNALADRSTEIVSLTAADGTTLYRSPSATRLLGWSVDELAAHKPADLVVAEDRAHFAAALGRLASGEQREISFGYRLRHRDGSIRWLETSATNLLDDPDVGAIVGSHRDVTAQRLAETALQESRNLLEEAQAIAHVGSWVSSIDPPDGARFSRECYRVFGMPEGSIVTAEAAIACVHPDDRARVIQAGRDAVERGIPADLVHRVLRPNGTTAWIHARAEVERDAAGRPLRLIGSAQDITERHLVVEALKASEQRYRRIVESTSEGIWMCDGQGITTFMNGRMAAMLGVTVAGAIGRPAFSFMDPSVRAEAASRLQQRDLGSGTRSEISLQHEDGSVVWASVIATPLIDGNGEFEGALALVADVSAERSADEVRARLAAIVESSQDAIVSTDLHGIVTSWNLSAETLYQYSAAEMLGQSIFVLTPAPLVDAERALFDSAARNLPTRQHETQRRRKDGSIVEVALTLSPVKDGNGVVIGVSKIARDLSERRRAEAALRRTEEQFRQAQKMEAVGRLAGGVAHDFNNLLSIILSYSSLAIEELNAGDPLREELQQIQLAGERATELTRQLLAFSRQQMLEPRVIDLNEIVGAMKSMLARLLGEDIELTLVMAQKGGRVIADPGQIEQVVMNLAINARDAMPDGGKLTLKTANTELDDAYAAAHLGVTAGAYVMLSVSDTGTGMDAKTIARIFEPFYTTKEQGKGTGLGLSTVFGIVQQSGGHVDVYSEPGQGSTFKIYLPRTDRVADAPSAAHSDALQRGKETILLVEDEDQVRAVACAIMRRNGYHVLETSNGGEALVISKDFPAKIHLLITDVVMPRMSGRKLVEQLAPLRPEMKVLFASGYTDDAIIHHGILDADVAFLQKPFTPDSLLRKVRAVLDDRKP
jgi:two-component system, cell cycle sensor histidine kinase and response regulator CckA